MHKLMPELKANNLLTFQTHACSTKHSIYSGKLLKREKSLESDHYDLRYFTSFENSILQR